MKLTAARLLTGRIRFRRPSERILRVQWPTWQDAQSSHISRAAFRMRAVPMLVHVKDRKIIWRANGYREGTDGAVRVQERVGELCRPR